MKFQIILESTDKKTARLADYEFEKLVRAALKKLDGFKLIGARSLEGIQDRAWEPASRDALD